MASSRWLPRGVVLAALGIFNLVLFNRYFPLSEGWWETYGYLYNSGLRPYRDFDLAYTPLFTILNAGLLRLFGDSFFALRLFGVAVLLVAVLLLQLLLEQAFRPWTAAIATLVSTTFMMAQPQFIAKDYHVYQLGLVALSILLHVRLAQGEGMNAAARIRGTVLLGATVCLVFMLKQNVGALLLVGFAASLPLVERERPMLRCAAFAAGALLPFVLLLPVVGLSDWRQLLFANDAKGDLATVLLRFWHPDNRTYLAQALLIFLAYRFAWWAIAPPARWGALWTDDAVRVLRRPRVRAVGFVAVLAAIAASGDGLRRVVMPWAIPAALAVTGVALHQLVLAVRRRSAEGVPLAAVALPLLALAYANTTTASFDHMALQIPIAFGLGWVLSVIEAQLGVRAWALATAVLVIVIPELVAAKLRRPYDWWGGANTQASVGSARSEPAYPQLRRIRVGAAQKRALDEIKVAVDQYSRSRTDALFFDLPVLYLLHDKLPPFRAVVNWFDVVSSRQMDAEMRALREHPPRLVVALEPPPRAFAVHRVVRNQKRLPQEDFWAQMDAWVEDGTYHLVQSIPLPSDPRGDENRISQEIVVQNEHAIGLPRTGVEELAGEGVVVSFPREEAGAAAGCGLAAGQIVTASGLAPGVRALSSALGVARGAPRDWNTVNVYVRADAP